MKFVRDESGQSIVVLGFFLALVSLGLLAVALDAGQLFRKERMAQASADSAAMAYAAEVAHGTGSELQVAKNVAKLNGFDTTLASNPAKLTVTYPYTWNGNANNVKVVVSQPVKTTFLGALTNGLSVIPVAASAVAGGAYSSSTCVCLTGALSTSVDLDLTNGSKIDAPNCGIVENSPGNHAIEIIGGAIVSAISLGTVSTTWDNSSNLYNGGSISASTKVIQGIQNGCSATMPAVPSYGTCYSDPGASTGNVTVGPTTAGGTICYDNLTMGNNGATTTMRPGIYVIKGYLTFNYGANNISNTGGNGVFFYIAPGGSVTMQNGAVVNLVAGGDVESNGLTVAPSTGSYNGVLFYQDSANSNTVTIQGGATTYMAGDMLAPAAQLNLDNGTNTSVTGGVVALGLNMAGGATLHATTATNEGSLVITAPKVEQ